MKSLAFLISVLGISISCHAAILTVNPNGSAQYSNLKQALAQAQSGDTIQLQPGLYRGSLNKDLSFSRGSLTLESIQGPLTCIIDCESKGQFLKFSGSRNALLTLKGLTIINASSDSSIIDITGNSMNMDNCSVSHCVSSPATYNGGVIYGTNGETLTITRSRFFNNTSKTIEGVFNACASAVNAWEMQVTIDHCLFANNDTETFGGAIFIYSLTQADKTLAITNCIFHNNEGSAEYPGSALVGYVNQATLISNCIMSNNSNTAMSFYKEAQNDNVTVNHCLFFNNSGGLCVNLITGTSASSVADLGSVVQASDNITGNPQFALEQDFHVRGNSAAIDQGLTTPELTDLDGVPRRLDGDLNGSVVQDIGPYEYDPNHPLIVAARTSLTFVTDVNAPNPGDQTLSFLNTTSSPLNWHLSSDASWLDVSDHTGTLINSQTTVTVSVASNGMSRGIYTGLLTLTDPNAVNSPVQVLVSLKIRGTLSVPEDFPSILEAVNDAMPGELIEVHGGTYPDSFVIDKPLTLMGHEAPSIEIHSGIGLQIEADNCLVQGFHLWGGSHGLTISGSNTTVKNMTITGSSTGVTLTGGSKNTLDQIAISDCSDYGLNIQNSPQNTLTNITLENCA
ncbi:MAG: right-handed parallel beta-helix repeat-containing protein, partial [Phycisphaerae bacterium]|nr:right-handed parallel beta-helix repeat-containing protein [Phycisphaerae bacterium]